VFVCSNIFWVLFWVYRAHRIVFLVFLIVDFLLCPMFVGVCLSDVCLWAAIYFGYCFGYIGRTGSLSVCSWLLIFSFVLCLSVSVSHICVYGHQYILYIVLGV